MTLSTLQSADAVLDLESARVEDVAAAVTRLIGADSVASRRDALCDRVVAACSYTKDVELVQFARQCVAERRPHVLVTFDYDGAAAFMSAMPCAALVLAQHSTNTIDEEYVADSSHTMSAALRTTAERASALRGTVKTQDSRLSTLVNVCTYRELETYVQQMFLVKQMHAPPLRSMPKTSSTAITPGGDRILGLPSAEVVLFTLNRVVLMVDRTLTVYANTWLALDLVDGYEAPLDDALARRSRLITLHTDANNSFTAPYELRVAFARWREQRAGGTSLWL